MPPKLFYIWGNLRETVSQPTSKMSTFIGYTHQHYIQHFHETSTELGLTVNDIAYFVAAVRSSG